MFKFIDALLFLHGVRQTFKTSVLNNGLNTKTFSMQLERKSSTNINLNTASILSVKVKQHNTSVSSSFHNSL